MRCNDRFCPKCHTLDRGANDTSSLSNDAQGSLCQSNAVAISDGCNTGFVSVYLIDFHARIEARGRWGGWWRGVEDTHQ